MGRVARYWNKNLCEELTLSSQAPSPAFPERFLRTIGQPEAIYQNAFVRAYSRSRSRMSR